jgi:hypothetical protein
MSESANVHSIDLLKHLQEVLARFGVDAQTALGSATLEILRVQNALEEKLKYWQQQGFKRHEEMNQARAALSHARALHEGKSIGCVEQEIALRKAQERVREAEAKFTLTKRWLRELPNVAKEEEGPARALSGFLETNLRQGIALLESKVASLEAYFAIDAGNTEPAPASPRPGPEPAPATTEVREAT